MLNCIELNSQRIVALKLFFQLLLLIYIFSCFRNSFSTQDKNVASHENDQSNKPEKIQNPAFETCRYLQMCYHFLTIVQ